MVIYPILAPNVLEHRSSIVVNNSAILSEQHTNPVKQVVIDVIHNRSCTIVRVRALSLFAIATIEWNTLGVFELNNIAKQYFVAFFLERSFKNHSGQLK